MCNLYVACTGGRSLLCTVYVACTGRRPLLCTVYVSCTKGWSLLCTVYVSCTGGWSLLYIMLEMKGPKWFHTLNNKVPKLLFLIKYSIQGYLGAKFKVFAKFISTIWRTKYSHSIEQIFKQVVYLTLAHDNLPNDVNISTWKWVNVIKQTNVGNIGSNGGKI